MMSRAQSSRIRWRSALDFFKHKKKSVALGPDSCSTIAPLLLALARVIGIPARTCTGIQLNSFVQLTNTAFPFHFDEERLDYHCWCEIWSQNGWQRINLLPGFSTMKYETVQLAVTKKPSSQRFRHD